MIGSCTKFMLVITSVTKDPRGASTKRDLILVCCRFIGNRRYQQISRSRGLSNLGRAPWSTHYFSVNVLKKVHATTSESRSRFSCSVNLLRSISGHSINISTLYLVNSDYLCFLVHCRLLGCWCGMLCGSFQYLGRLSWLLLPLFARGVWPFRGFRIGEARKPGPEIDLDEPEPLEDLLLLQ